MHSIRRSAEDTKPFDHAGAFGRVNPGRCLRDGSGGTRACACVYACIGHAMRRHAPQARLVHGLARQRCIACCIQHRIRPAVDHVVILLFFVSVRQ
ncbi:hypothetical protein AQ611_23655 [Burkholderia singularis]|nr:hypothetical protein AQ611_23655 [Burkholderia sp. Bp7605]